MRHALLPALALATALVLPGAALASSHSEAPGTSKDRLADDTDLYAWVAPDAPHSVTFVGNWVPLIEPNSGPNFASFDDDATYFINIDNVGDCLDHIQYQFEFRTVRRNPNTFLYNTGIVTSLDDPDLNVRQFATVTRLDNGVATVLADDVQLAPYDVGPASMPDYASLAQAAVRTLPDGSRLFIGPRDDPFFVDLAAIFDLLTVRQLPGDHGGGVDGLGGFNVMTIALQVPDTRLTRDGAAPNAGNAVIGVYDSAERARIRMLMPDGTVSQHGPAQQVSRLGNPLVNEVVIPLKDKDRFNASEPKDDAQFLNYVLDPELPRLLHALYGLPVPTTPRNDLVSVFLTGIPGLNQSAAPSRAACDMLRLNMAIPPAASPNRLGVLGGDVAGFPNGRRLSDDVVDIAERAAAGGYPLTPAFDAAPANQLGDGVDANDVPLLPYFPYVAPPHDPFAPHHAPAGNAVAPAGFGAAAAPA
ncbi:MAG TPA: DUF4331 domain-containing protein, partial [Candidatus Eisenbacteria bacterium]|nr:DUF4331 domain-containing protein [Candidatus Eisenbacteria bacterium]